MKAYVATKWERKERAREIIHQLSQRGIQITYDWTVSEGPTVEQAISDLNGVVAADFIVCIFEEDLRYMGSLVEMGAALATGKPVYVLGHALDGHNIFLKHPNVRSQEDFERQILNYPSVAGS